MNDLTEQWKNKELRHGGYYVKIVDVVFIDFFDATKLKFIRFKEKYIDEILAPVPSYEELQRFKGLLKECKESLSAHQDICFEEGYTEEENIAINLIKKIDEVLDDRD